VWISPIAVLPNFAEIYRITKMILHTIKIDLCFLITTSNFVILPSTLQLKKFSMSNREYDYLPYDPSDVDIRRQSFPISLILDMMDYGDIELWREDDYQRSFDNWNISQKSRLIESLIMRIPLPIFYFDGSTDRWKIIDGLHRLTTLKEFLTAPSFKLSGMEYLSSFEGLHFHQLPFSYQRVIKNFTIEAYIINPGTPQQVKLNIFKRINTGGRALSDQEIRNTFYQGKATDFVNRLAEQSSFLKATARRISRKGMKDREMVLRFIAFLKYLYEYTPPLQLFLDKVMERIGDYDYVDLKNIEDNFSRAMETSYLIFGDAGFFMPAEDGERSAYSNNAFEAWVVNLAMLDTISLHLLLSKKVSVINHLTLLRSDEAFISAISSGTASKKSVLDRFSLIKNLITNIIND